MSRLVAEHGGFGLLSSVLHLANSKNAWCSFIRFRTSWLSREAVFAVLLYPALLLVARGAEVAHYRVMEVPERPTGQAALDMSTAARVKLLDAGHSHGTYLTDKFAFRLARERADQLRIVVAVAGFLLPLLLLLTLDDATPLAALLCLAGLLVERWPFFAGARHTVNPYQKR